MPNCRVCNKEIDYYDWNYTHCNWEYSYCTEKCWKKSRKYKQEKALGYALVCELKRETLDKLKEVFDENQDSVLEGIEEKLKQDQKEK